MAAPIHPDAQTSVHPDAAAVSDPADARSWSSLLDRVSRDHEGDRVTIAPLDGPTSGYGGRPVPQRLPFTYASYSSRDNNVVVAVGGTTPTLPVVLRHLIWKPARLWVTGTSLRVVDTDGVATEVTFFPSHPQ